MGFFQWKERGKGKGKKLYRKKSVLSWKKGKKATGKKRRAM